MPDYFYEEKKRIEVTLIHSCRQGLLHLGVAATLHRVDPVHLVGDLDKSSVGPLRNTRYTG